MAKPEQISPPTEFEGLADYGERLKGALADARQLRALLDEIEEWQAAAYVTQAENRLESLIANVSPPGA